MPDTQDIRESQENNTPESLEGVNEDTSQERTIVSAELHTSNPGPQTENMEVHHHPTVGNKNLKEYLLEGLMIFLAVTLGFFAEQIREGFAERRQQKEYVRSFYEDLKADTARISFNMGKDEEKIVGLKNIADCYDSVTTNPRSASCMFTLFKSSTTNYPFQITDRTIKQLANAGGFRLLEKEDADSITNYVSAVNRLDNFQSTVYQGIQDNVRNTFNTLVSFRANTQMLKPDQRAGIGSLDDNITEPVLFSNDKALLNQYFNQLLLYDRVTIGRQNLLKVLKQDQIRLIEYFKKKYQFE